MKKHVAFLLSIMSIFSCSKEDEQRAILVAAILDLSGHYSQFGQKPVMHSN